MEEVACIRCNDQIPNIDGSANRFLKVEYDSMGYVCLSCQQEMSDGDYEWC